MISRKATPGTFSTGDVLSGSLTISKTSWPMTSQTQSKNGVWTFPADWPIIFLRKFSIRKDTLGCEQRDKLSDSQHAYRMNQ